MYMNYTLYGAKKKKKPMGHYSIGLKIDNILPSSPPTKELEKTKTTRVFTRMSYRYNSPNIQPSSIYSTKKCTCMYI
jgi:hypothetical protein